MIPENRTENKLLKRLVKKLEKIPDKILLNIVDLFRFQSHIFTFVHS